MGLKIPLVYNTGGYDSIETIKALDGIIDIYLPDLRYASDKIAKQFSQAPHYVENSRQAIKEMYRQVGKLQTDANDIALRGLIVRHLILPEGLAGVKHRCPGSQTKSRRKSVSAWWRNIIRRTMLHVIRLFLGNHEAEYLEVIDLLEELGIENGWIQEMSAPENYQPDFERENHPFNPV